MQHARNSLCKKQWAIFMRKERIILLNTKKDFLNTVSKFENTVNMMSREKILLM